MLSRWGIPYTGIYGSVDTGAKVQGNNDGFFFSSLFRFLLGGGGGDDDGEQHHDSASLDAVAVGINNDAYIASDVGVGSGDFSGSRSSGGGGGGLYLAISWLAWIIVLYSLFSEIRRRMSNKKSIRKKIY